MEEILTHSCDIKPQVVWDQRAAPYIGLVHHWNTIGGVVSRMQAQKGETHGP